MSHFHRNEERHRLKLNKGPCDLLSDVAHIRPQTAAATAAGIIAIAVERIEEPDTGKTQNSFRHFPKKTTSPAGGTVRLNGRRAGALMGDEGRDQCFRW